MSKISDVIKSGNCILVLGELWDNETTTNKATGLAWLRRELLKIANAESDVEMTLSDALIAARLANIQAADSAIATYSQTMTKTIRSEMLQRLLDGPFERIYDLSNPWLTHSMLADADIQSTDPAIEFEPRRGVRQFVHLCGTSDRPVSVNFSPPPSGSTGPRMQWYKEFMADASIRPLLVIARQAHAELWEFLRVRTIADREDLDALSSAVLVVSPNSTVSKARLLTMGLEVWQSEPNDLIHLLHPGRQEVSEGHRRLRRLQALETPSTGVNLVEHLIRNSGESTWAFLKGEDPLWSDVRSQRLARLDVETRLRSAIRRTQGRRNVVLVRGRAGSGKTALLMRLADAWSRRGDVTGWIDRSATKSVGQIVDQAASLGCDAIFVDDVDIFGYSAPSLLRRLNRNGSTLVIASIRTTQMWAMSGSGVTLTTIDADESLSDRDLTRLLETLEAAGMLGTLLAVHPPSARIDRFREMSQRDLLAALLEVVTGESFERRISSEFSQLGRLEQDIYGLVSFYAAYMYEGTHLPAPDLIRITDSSPPFIEATRALKNLTDKRLVVDDQGGIRARHRAIADALLASTDITSRQIASYVERFLLFYVGRAAYTTDSTNPDRRQMIKVLNHNLMIKLRIRPATVREIYVRIQPSLQEDFHFWLQRGAYDVETGALDDGQRYLVAARALPGGATDYKVATEWGRVRLRMAMRRLDDAREQDRAAESLVELERICKVQGTAAPHTFTIVMREGSEWLKQAMSLDESRRRRLVELVIRVRDLAKEVFSDNGQVMQAERESRRGINELYQSLGGRYPVF